MEILFAATSEYVLVTVTGEPDIQAEKQSFRRLLDMCAERKLFKAIIDRRNVVEGMSLNERLTYFDWADELHRDYVNRGQPTLNVAYVHKRFRKTKHLMKLRGISFNLFPTKTIKSAEKWIKTPADGVVN